MSEFRLIGWREGLASCAEWSRNNPGLAPNTYERCRELASMWKGEYSLFEIHVKQRGRWELFELLGKWRDTA